MTTKKLKRVESAQKRQLAYDKLTTTDKLLKLNHIFGEGVGAVKERKKLAAKLELEKSNKENQNSNLATGPKTEKKQYQKPKRS